jgi:hypothetical protein
MPTLPAALIAPAELLSGPGFTVDAEAPVAGYMGQFTLRASSGTFAANGTEMLAIRVAELSSIAQLAQLSQTGVFADALAASARRTGAAIGQAVLNPVATVEGIPGGIGRFFNSASRTVSRAAESATAPASAQSTGAVDATMDAVGLNRARRQIAQRVGANPYTTNPVLAAQLSDLAAAAFAGGVSLDVALAVSTAGVATAVSATATVSNLVWERSPQDIRTLHEGKLAAMGIAGDTIRQFVTNRWFTPTLSVPLVAALEEMPTAKGRAAVVALASSVGSEGEARFVLNAVTMARRIGTANDPVVGIELAGRIMTVRTRSGRLEVPAPVDYIVWTEPVKAFAEARNLKGIQRIVLATGTASPAARQGLTATGWALREQSRR